MVLFPLLFACSGWPTEGTPPNPVAALPPPASTPACCAIGDGPWHVRTIGMLDGALNEIGRIWAYAPHEASTPNADPRTWTEYADQTRAWEWLGPNVTWDIDLAPVDNEPDPRCTPAAPCAQLDVSFSKPSNWPGSKALQALIAGAAKAGQYHAEGRYRVLAIVHDPAGTVVLQGWFYTKEAGNNTRTEVWCTPQVWSWPARAATGKPKVTWEISNYSALASSLPTKATECEALPDGGVAEGFYTRTVGY